MIDCLLFFSGDTHDMTEPLPIFRFVTSCLSVASLLEGALRFWFAFELEAPLDVFTALAFEQEALPLSISLAGSVAFDEAFALWPLLWFPSSNAE